MNIFPAIDMFSGKAVRLLKGDYHQMTVYGDDPLLIAKDFEKQGAKFVHLVDLEGAKDGTTPHLGTVIRIKENTSLFCEIGGGIRNIETVKKYINSGIDRVIIGTAAITDEKFLKEAVRLYGEKIAVGVDVKDGFVAIKGWTEKTEQSCFDFCRRMKDTGINTLICTDISKDGAMQGTNRQLYRELSESLDINITASGGISHMDDVKCLAQMKLYGAIIGKAYYTGAIDLKEAIEVSKC